MEDNQVQARVPLYYKWVIEGLVGRRGKSRSEVLSRLIGEWIEAKEETLRKWGLSLEEFQAEQSSGPRGLVKEMSRSEQPPQQERRGDGNSRQHR